MSNDGNSHFPPVSSTEIMFEAIGKSFLLNFIWSRGSEWIFLFLVDLKISLLSWELSSKWGKIVKMQLSFKLNFDKNPTISLSISLITTSSTGLTIYLQLDFVLHHVPLPDVVVGGGADEEVAVVAGLGVVQQHWLAGIVVGGGVNDLNITSLGAWPQYLVQHCKSTAALVLHLKGVFGI